MTPVKKSKKPSAVQDILDFVTRKLDAGKADNITTLCLKEKSSLTDYMVIATGTSSRHVTSLVHHLSEALKEKGIKPFADGMAGDGVWVVLDIGDIIVHVFTDEARRRYALEEIWSA